MGKSKEDSKIKIDDILNGEFEIIKKNREQNRIHKDKKLKNLKKDDNINKELLGLCLSGGGIRSATFNLGILQSFARIGILRLIDYLSTVSGGGYIGSCLSSLLTKEKTSVRWDESFPFFFNRGKNSDEREELKHLRHFSSNYLIPDKVRTNDFWGMIGSYITGFILTNIITAAFVIIIAFTVNFLAKTAGDQNVNLPLFFLIGSLFSFIPALIIRFISSFFMISEGDLSIRDLIEDINGLLAGLSISFAVLAGLIELAEFMPEIFKHINWYVHGITIASVTGLLTGIMKINKKIINISFRISLLLIVPLLIAELIYLFSSFDFFKEEKFFIVFGFRMPEILIYASLLLLISCFVKSNRISIHSFYRDKLSKAFIITRENKKKKTDSKDKADILFSNDRCSLTKLHEHNNGPYHIINATLNIPTTKNILFRGRKSDLFFFSKLYCGSEATGYKPTENFYKNKLTVTTAMAVSGAAISPEMGMFSNPIFSFFFTIFNVRLNRWLPNPLYDNFKFRIFLQPYYFLKELFCLGKENEWYVNISDGGHFDNSGLYSLIKRRCRYIIVSDAGEDKNHFIKDLSITLRRIRIDMGASIEMDFTGIRPDEKTGFSPMHFAVGKIKYAEADNVDAFIIYIKSLVAGNDPEDIISYKKQNPIFPDQSTMDQFFDEAQFESYRNLGYVSGRSLIDMYRDKNGNEDKKKWPFNSNDKTYTSTDLLKFFDKLYRYYEKECRKIKNKKI